MPARPNELIYSRVAQDLYGEYRGSILMWVKNEPERSRLAAPLRKASCNSAGQFAERYASGGSAIFFRKEK
jgi:hypothetical protein